MTTLKGIDVSTWQGTIDWGAVASSDNAFAIAKATEGNGYTDPQWGNNQAALLAPGPLVGGSYHFCRPDLGNTPEAEAQWYLGRHDVRVFEPTTPWIFALDFEVAGGNDAWVRGFLGYVRGHVGYECWFYSSPSKIQERGVTPNSSPLWIAYYVPDPNQATPPNMGWPAVTNWQWGGAPVPGIAGSVDANIFYGDQQTLLLLAGAGGHAPEPSGPSKTGSSEDQTMVTFQYNAAEQTFCVDSAGKLQQRYFDALGWHGPVERAAGLVPQTGLSFDTDFNGGLHLYGRSTIQDKVVHAFYTPAGGWGSELL
jgi:GH25 family lysozyme M1 (1,4-beta-N-acetylmuramidase)